jgi:hypothetical protein
MAVVMGEDQTAMTLLKAGAGKINFDLALTFAEEHNNTSTIQILKEWRKTRP